MWARERGVLPSAFFPAFSSGIFASPLCTCGLYCDCVFYDSSADLVRLIVGIKHLSWVSMERGDVCYSVDVTN